MNDEQLEAFAQFVSFVREIRNHYSWLTDESDLVNEIAAILERPVSHIEMIVRRALAVLREIEKG